MKQNSLAQLLELLNIDPSKLKEIFQENFLQALLPYFLNTIMEKEREFHLKEVDDYKNGSYNRTLFLGTIPLEVSVPRTRTSGFFPSIIKKYSRVLPDSYHTLMESLILSCRSINSLKLTLSKLGLPFLENEIEEIVNTLAFEFECLNSRELEKDLACNKMQKLFPPFFTSDMFGSSYKKSKEKNKERNFQKIQRNNPADRKSYIF